jgi:hypothetical protein
LSPEFLSFILFRYRTQLSSFSLLRSLESLRVRRIVLNVADVQEESHYGH